MSQRFAEPQMKTTTTFSGETLLFCMIQQTRACVPLMRMVTRMSHALTMTARLDDWRYNCYDDNAAELPALVKG